MSAWSNDEVLPQLDLWEPAQFWATQIKSSITSSFFFIFFPLLGRMDTVFQEMVILEEDTEVLHVDDQPDMAVFQIECPNHQQSQGQGGASKRHGHGHSSRVVRFIANF